MERKKIYRVTSSALVSAWNVGYALTYYSAATMGTSKLHPIDSGSSWIGSILPLGAILGGLIAGYLSDRIGRKGVMVHLSLPLVLAWLFVAYAPSMPFVYIGRFVIGICCGLICVVAPMYVVEVSPAEMRGSIGSTFQMYICFGIMLNYSLSISLSLEWVAIIGATCVLIMLLFVLFIPESPHFLVLNNKQSEAVHAINFLYGTTGDSSVNRPVSENAIGGTSHMALHEILHPTFYKPAILSIILMFFQQFSGFNAILFYTVPILKQSSNLHFGRPNLIFCCFMLGFTAVACYLMHMIGRKKALYISGFVTFISLNCMSIYLLLSAHHPSLKSSYGWVPLLCLIVYFAGFSFGLGPIPWFMMSEMTPLRGRGLICGLGTACSWMFLFISTKCFLPIESLVESFGAFWIYSAFCLCSCFFAFFFLPETEGKTLEEIENYFSGGESHLQRLHETSNDGCSDCES